MDARTNPPAGYAEVEKAGPFLALTGPLYVRREGKQFRVAMRLEEKHLNASGIAHGGMLAAFADSALGMSLCLATRRGPPMVTVSLTTDFLGAGLPGDWLEAAVEIAKVGGRLAFASCLVTAGERRVFRASGVFAVVRPRKRSERAER